MDRLKEPTSVPKVYVQSGIVVIALSLYLIGLIVYRLFLSRVARIPGSKFSPATGWYAT